MVKARTCTAAEANCNGRYCHCSGTLTLCTECCYHAREVLSACAHFCKDLSPAWKQVPLNGASSAAEAVNSCSQALKQEYGALEQQLDVSVRQSRKQVPRQVLSTDSAERLLTLLLTLPHGVQKFSHTVPGPLSHTLPAVLHSWEDRQCPVKPSPARPTNVPLGLCDV